MSAAQNRFKQARAAVRSPEARTREATDHSEPTRAPANSAAPRALVLGLGASGLAMARWLSTRGYELRVADTRSDPPQLDALREACAGAHLVTGPWSDKLLDDVDLVALSPGLAPTQRPLAPLLKAAKARKIEVAGEIELFARELARLKEARGYAPKIVGVTGTNGKTTTTRLAGLLLERAGVPVTVAGNIGPAALDALRDALAVDALPAAWVLELSSFQLATTRSLACDVAAVLNITQDHLDWHDTMDAYVAAKARIFTARTVQVLNRDDPRVMAMARKHAEVVTFGSDPPATAESYGLVLDNGITWLTWAEDVNPARRRRQSADAPTTAPHLLVHRLMPSDALRIRGRHNALNALAALALARAAGASLSSSLHALSSYAGEPHRVEPIAAAANVEYIDDSKGTNVGATVAALDGLGAENRKLVVILGGDGKGQDFTPLAAPLVRHARAAVLIGRDAGVIRAVLERDASSVPLHEAIDLREAVRVAAGIARAGDAVLLSPACASFDMFRNYEHRSEVFAEAVRQLVHPEGQPC